MAHTGIKPGSIIFGNRLIEIASRDRRTLFMFGCACHYRSSKAPQTSASLCLNLDRRAGVPRHRAILKKLCMCTPRFAGVRGKSWRTGRVLEGGRGHGSVLGLAGEVLDAPWGSLGSVPGSREAHFSFVKHNEFGNFAKSAHILDVRSFGMTILKSC